MGGGVGGVGLARELRFRPGVGRGDDLGGAVDTAHFGPLVTAGVRAGEGGVEGGEVGAAVGGVDGVEEGVLLGG